MKFRNGADILKGPSATVYFATTNRGKFIEAARITSRFGIRLNHLKFEKQEIQSNDLREIASFAAKQAAQLKRCAVVAEDAGFFVNALNGFPGPYSSYVFKTLGTKGILTLISTQENRKALFKAAVAYCAPKKRPHSFSGVVKGVVSPKGKGNLGFGFDPIFIPNDGDGRTFAEMTIDEKNAIPSHRALAFSKFCQWFTAKRDGS